jgi:hypothetical protein
MEPLVAEMHGGSLATTMMMDSAGESEDRPPAAHRMMKSRVRRKSMPPPMDRKASPASTRSASMGPSSIAPVEVPAQRMLVKEGHLSFWVGRSGMEDAKARVLAIATHNGGYAEEIRSEGGDQARGRAGMHRSDGHTGISITIRVPVEKFEAATKEIKEGIVEMGSGARITHEQASARDVTAQFVDLVGRLHALQIAHEKLTALMEKAEKVPQVLSVLGELTTNLQKKDALEARIKSMEKLSSLSTLRVSISEDFAAPPPPSPTPWRFSTALQSARGEWVDLADMVTGWLAHAAVFDIPLFILAMLALVICSAAMRVAYRCAAQRFPWMQTGLWSTASAPPSASYPDL